MKKIVTVTELESLMGEKVILLCMNYNYVGTLIGVNEKFVLLDEADAAVCYETGEWSAKSWTSTCSCSFDPKRSNKPNMGLSY